MQRDTCLHTQASHAKTCNVKKTVPTQHYKHKDPLKMLLGSFCISTADRGFASPVRSPWFHLQIFIISGASFWVRVCVYFSQLWTPPGSDPCSRVLAASLRVPMRIRRTLFRRSCFLGLFHPL